MMNQRPILALAAAGAIALAGGAFWLSRGSSDMPPAFSIAAEAQEVGPTDEQMAMAPDMVLGDETAPVTMVEYASFTCPHCMNFHKNVFPQLKADYIDTGKLRFVYREVYFDRYGLWAAMLARCDGGSRYFGIADLIYATQADWIGDGEPAAVADNLRKIGLTAGMEAETVEACLNDQAMAEAMVLVFQKNATADEVNSTPSFVIDGTRYSNLAYAEMQALLDAAAAD